MIVGFGSSSSINGSDETLGCKSLPLSHVRSIKDGALKFYHVAHEEEALRDCVSLIINQRERCHHTFIEVHRGHLISDIITLQMNY